MVGDFNSWWRLFAEGLPFIDTADSFYERAVRNCYSALCHNSEGSGTFGCSFNIDDVGQVLIAYISIYTSPDIFSIDSKYLLSGGKYYGYYDEYKDRFDAYRIGLLNTIATGIGKSVDFVNSVLSYCYWNSDGRVRSDGSRGNVPLGILRPAGVARFKDADWYIKDPWKSLFKISDATLNFIRTAGSVVVQAVELAVDGVSSTVKAAGWVLNNWHWLLGGGLVLFIGGQLYIKRSSGKFMGEDSVRKVVKSKTGLGDKKSLVLNKNNNLKNSRSKKKCKN